MNVKLRVHVNNHDSRRIFLQAYYLIVDLSDITWLYARKMEGLGRVHVGSSVELSKG